MRVCKKCGESKPVSEFYKHAEGKDGLRPECKSCTLARQQQYRQENSEAHRARAQRYREENREKCAAKDREYYQRNLEENRAKRRMYYQENADARKAYIREWQLANPEKVRAAQRASKARNPDAIRSEYERNKHQYFDRAAKRRVKVKEVTPSWSDEAQVREIYQTCRNLNQMFQMLEFHVDHVVPLVNDAVCGLHSHTNLQILVGEENLSKGNRHWPDMP